MRDDPAARIELVERPYHGPYGTARRHLPYRRAALSFMRWQLRRGVLAPAHDERPGSAWWRAVNERLVRDGCDPRAPRRVPADLRRRAYLSAELGFGRLLDFGVIIPRLQQIYDWSARELGEPGLRDCTRTGR